MRTSRLAKETAKLFEALSPSKRVSRRLTRSASEAVKTEAVTPIKDEEKLSDEGSNHTSSRKRKREPDHSPSVRKLIKHEEAVVTRRSPRKPGNLSPGVDGKPRKARRQPAKQIKGPDGLVIKTEPPPEWEEVYNVTGEMRKLVPAPVDTMGCESLAEDSRTPRDRRFQTLISLMLSSQTKDTVTAVAIKNLQEGMPGGFTLESTLEVEPTVLNSMINKVGFHNNKTQFIKAAAIILRDEWNSDIPDTIEGMISLPGVGPKMAYLLMSAAWGRDEGIGVDVHVHRITNLWGWHKTSTPEQTREMLQSWLPREKWHDINHLLVGFGQTWCPPVGKKCDECWLAERSLCPSAVVSKSVKARVTKDEAIIKVDSEDAQHSTVVDVKLENRGLTADEVKLEACSPSRHLRDMEDYR